MEDFLVSRMALSNFTTEHFGNESVFGTISPSFRQSAAPSAGPTSPPSSNSMETVIQSTDTNVLRKTIQVYGTVYLVLLALFCILRLRYNRYFNVRSWVKEWECDIAKTSNYGLISWMWQVFQVKEDDILEQCGMDALCFIRVLTIGRKLAIVGCCQACWLIPVYATAESSPETDYLTDKLALISTAHLPSTSPRFLATVICAYVVFGYAMLLIQRELKWYTLYRHKFLCQRRARNYAIYCSGIPEELRSGIKLAEFFRQSGATTSVLEAHVTLACPELDALVAQREEVKHRLAHAEAFQQKHGRRKTESRLNLRRLGRGSAQQISRSMEKQNNILLEKIDSIESLRLKLRQLTKDIAFAHQNIERANDPYSLDQHRDVLMQEIEEMRQAVAHQNIAFRERVNSGHDLTNFEEICHKEEQITNEGELCRVRDQYSMIAEAFFFGEVSPQKNSEEQLGLLRTLADKNNKQDERRGTIHNEIHYIGRRDIPSATVPDLDNDANLNQKSSENKINGKPELIHNTFPSKSTISTISGTFDNQSGTKWSRSSPYKGNAERTGTQEDYARRVISTPNMGAAGSVSFSDSERMEESRSEKVPHILRRKGQDFSHDRSDGSSDELKGSCQSWSISASDVIRRVGNGVQTIGGDVGKTVVVVGAGVGKATKLSLKAAGDLSISNIQKVGGMGVKNVQNVAGNVNKLGWQAAEMGVENIKTIRESAAAVVPVVLAHKEGKALEAGFVVFKDIYSTQAALQMLHHKEAGVMQVEEAPDPDEIFWRNVGLPGTAQRTGRLLSVTATVFLCLFWTVPVSVISALTEVNSLKKTIPALADLVEKYPSLQSVLALIAPLLLLMLQNLVLPEFLRWFATWEGHVSSSTLESAVFVKYAAFALLQTFYISAISGSISAELTNMMNNPDQIIYFLANALPAQSNYFLQILVVAMAITMGCEMLRVYPLGLALVRSFVGPNLTEEERKRSWKFFKPLEAPLEFEHATVSGSVVLYFMVFFVYCCLAPVSCFFLLIMFVLMESGYRYNFYHNYPPSPDSGGKHWRGFFHILLACMIVAQLTLVGFLILKLSLYATTLMVPLLVMTVLFIIYLNSYELHASDHLPSSDCTEIDKRNRLKDHSFCKGKYVQPCIREAQSDEIFEII